jgi:hypothetical protein
LLLLPERALDVAGAAEDRDGVGSRTSTTFLACRTSRRDGVADTRQSLVLLHLSSRRS